MANARKPALGNVPLGSYHDSVSILKQQLDMLTGRNGGEIATLTATDTASIVAKINQIIARLNASTN